MSSELVINPLFLIMVAVFVLASILVTFVILVLIGNLAAMKLLANKGVAVFCRDILKDYNLLNYVNKEGVAWLHIPNICYAPVMKYVGGKYKNHNFLQKPNLYGELYITEGESAIRLQKIAIESDNEIKDLTIIRGSAKGKLDSLRHSNFSTLRRSKELLRDSIEVNICDKGVVRKFKIVAILDMSIGEKHTFEYSCREKFIDSLLDMAVEKKKDFNKNNQVVLLQCKTEIDTTMVVLVEK